MLLGPAQHSCLRCKGGLVRVIMTGDTTESICHLCGQVYVRGHPMQGDRARGTLRYRSGGSVFHEWYMASVLDPSGVPAFTEDIRHEIAREGAVTFILPDEEGVWRAVYLEGEPARGTTQISSDEGIIGSKRWH